jgi:hypothetical protein
MNKVVRLFQNGLAGKQGFLPCGDSKLFNIKQLRAILLKTRVFIFTFSFLCFTFFRIFCLLVDKKWAQAGLINFL